MMRFITACLLASIASCAANHSSYVHAGANDDPPPVKNPEFLRQYAETRGFSLGLPASITIAPDNSAIFFLRSGPRSFVRDLYEFEVATRQERVLLTAEQILQGAEEQLSAEEKARRERQRMTARGISSYELSEDGSKILIPLSGRLFIFDRTTRATKEIMSDKGFPLDPKFSPDGKKVACVRDDDLYVTDIANGQERRLTTKGSEHITNGLSEFVAQEEMDRDRGYWWSPDSAFIAYQQTDTKDVEQLHIGDAFHPEQAPQNSPYPRAGKTNADVRLGVIPVEGGETRWIEWDKQAFPYLATVRWDKNAPLTLVAQNRHQTNIVVMSVDSISHEAKPLFYETDRSWLNIDQSTPRWLPDGGKFLWAAERHGAWHLELRDSYGKLVSELTWGWPLEYRGLASVPDNGRGIAIYGASEPLERQVYTFVLGPPVEGPQLLVGPGTLRSVVYGSDGSGQRVEWFNDLTERSPYYVFNSVGACAGRLQSVADQAPFKPNVELTSVEGDHTMHVAVIRPRDFNPRKRYPVIDSAYGGPHANVVTANMYAYLLDQWLADQGFIVVRIDGRGTPNRGREWERAIKRNFIEKPLEDHVTVLKALGERYPEMDLSRVGVYGWSFGGYFSAMAVMQRPDIYHAGVAGAPVCDWRDYDTHYTERYLGLPDENPEAYEASSVLTYAPNLKRPLFIIHGTTDDNVYFTHSLKMSDALFRAGIPHDFLPLSNFTHMVADPNVAERVNTAIARFFIKHLK